MTLVRVSGFSVSVDGFGAGPDQSIETPLGIGGEDLHGWMLETSTFRRMTGKSGGSTGVDDELVSKDMDNIGAWIMGRNMFGPVRGPWPDETWHGWWGRNPPYHTPVFVLTHYERSALRMEGGTEFHFETRGIHRALERAREAAGDRDIRILGGVSVIRQFMSAGLVDELHIAVSPIILGQGENLFHNMNLEELGYRVTGHTSTPDAMHLFMSRR